MGRNRLSSLSLPGRELGLSLSLRPIWLMEALSCNEPARRGRMQSQQAVRTQNLNYVSNHNKGCKVKREVRLLPLPPTPHPTAGSSDGCRQTISGPDIQPGRSRGSRTGHHWGFLYARLAFQRHLRSDLSFMVGHFETYMMRNTTSKEFKRARNASQSSDLESSIKASLQARW